MSLLLLVSLLTGCGGLFGVKDNCAKVFCGAGQFCLRTETPGDETGRETGDDDTGRETATDPFGDLPVCASAPDSCGPRVTCACLPDCTECTQEHGLVKCTVVAE